MWVLAWAQVYRCLPPGGQCFSLAFMLIKTKGITLNTHLGPNRILSLLFPVEGVFVGPQLRHLPRRPVHRHRIRRQESYSLRSDLLNCDWLKKTKQHSNQGVRRSLTPQHRWLYRAPGAGGGGRKWETFNSYFVLLFVFERNGRRGEATGHKVASLEKDGQFWCSAG